MVDFQLYLITDRQQTAGRALPAVVADALAGGVKAVQLREKDLPAGRLLELARELRSITREHGARLLVNDRLDVALAAEADGVHLGINSMPVSDVRKLAGNRMLIGYSAHSVAEALQAERDGADFVTFGPVFHTPSKAEYGAPLGLELLAEAAESLTIPIFALGGVKKSSIPAVMATDCHGVAMISAIIAADSPLMEAHELLNLLTE